MNPKENKNLQPVPAARRLNVIGFAITAGLIVIFLSLGVHLFFYLNAYLSDLFLNTWEINPEYVGGMVIFTLLLCVAALMIILFALDWEGKRIPRMARQYTSRFIVKDYYTQDLKAVEEDPSETKTPKAADSTRLAASVRPEPSEVHDQYKQGKIDGTFKEFFPNGNIKQEVHYIGGKLKGLYRTYYENGRIEQEAVYVDGQIEGIYRSYYEDGVLHQEKEYSHGKLNGVYKAYDESGLPFFEITYKNDVQHGSDKIFDAMGVIQFLDTYKAGVMVNRKTFDEYGNLKYDQDLQEPAAEAEAKGVIDKAVEREVQEKEKRRQGKHKKTDK